MAISRALILLGVAAGLACASPPEPGFRYLHATPTEIDPGFDPALPLAVSLEVADPDALLEGLPPAAVMSRGDRSLVVRLEPYPALVEPHPAPLASSYLIDHEDDAVRALIAQRDTGERPTLAELVVWVRETIEPSLDRGIDSASTVARTRRGDCTEHAVLMTALARHFGYPSRVVVGQVVARSGADVQAFGHAWTEVLEGERWQLVDATPIEGGEAIGYLPEGALRDEGYGYVMDLARIQVSGATRVRVLAAGRRTVR